MQNSVQMSRFHLPNVYTAVGAANDEEVIEWTPFNTDHWEKMPETESHFEHVPSFSIRIHLPTRQANALPFSQAEQRYRMI